MEVNVHDAKTNLARLIERVQAGEEVIIVKAAEMKPGWDDPLTDDELNEILGEP